MELLMGLENIKRMSFLMVFLFSEDESPELWSFSLLLGWGKRYNLYKQIPFPAESTWFREHKPLGKEFSSPLIGFHKQQFLNNKPQL